MNKSALQVTDQDRLQQEAYHSIQRAVEAGNVDEALRLTEGAAPGLLTAEPPLQISFQLKVLKFIELVSHLGMIGMLASMVTRAGVFLEQTAAAHRLF